MDPPSDPSDFLPTPPPFPLLTPLDASLRCQVCKDFYTNPVITSCSHTFCSLCIRRCLSAEGKCPACRADDQEVRLRQNWAVGEVVEAFRGARGGVLGFARTLGMERAEQGKGEEDGEGRMVKKRKLEVEESPRRTRSRSARQDQNESAARTTVVIEDSADEDYEPDDGLVACPICRRRMKEEAVFPHLNHCTGAPAQKEQRQPQGLFLSPRKPPSHPPERLPTINYSLMKDNILRKKLRDLGIPDWGGKPLLQRRHTEWVNLNNANCDSKHPKSKRELLKELEVWERSQGGQAGLYSRDQTPSVLRKDFDGAAWSAAHGDEFKRLIENARKGRDAVTRARSSEPPPAPASEPEPQLEPASTPATVPIPVSTPADDNPQTPAPSTDVMDVQTAAENPSTDKNLLTNENPTEAEPDHHKPVESSETPVLEGGSQRLVVEDTAA